MVKDERSKEHRGTAEMSADFQSFRPEPLPRTRISAGAYVLAVLSFIPLLGVVLGIGALLWAGISKGTGRLAVTILAICGIAFTFGLYGWLFHEATNPDGVFAPLSSQLAEQLLVENVKAIELFKLQTGSYPETLTDLQGQLPQGTMFSPMDPTIGIAGGMQDFYYERVGSEGYYLRSVGPDGQAFTADDVLPALGPGPQGEIGLLTDRQSGS
jgi:hypothetical protein